jgi:hypothetical protein
MINQIRNIFLRPAKSKSRTVEGGKKRNKFQQRTTQIWETKSNAPGSKKQTKYPINKSQRKEKLKIKTKEKYFQWRKCKLGTFKLLTRIL